MPDVSLSTEGVWSELRANIRGFVGRRVRQPADVDDIVQRVFLQVHRALPTLRDADRLHAWVYQTTRRAIADYYRAPSHTRECLRGRRSISHRRSRTCRTMTPTVALAGTQHLLEASHRESGTC
jgi:RNA polymerase sigma factor (sigma-70 family)